MMRVIPAAVVFILALGLSTVAAAQSTPALIEVRGSLYKLQDGDQAGVVLVASDSIVVVDPLGVGTGQWLRNELASRFPGKPIRFVVYASHAFERVAGGVAFPAATVVAHRRFNTETLQPSALPASLSTLDANRDGRLQSAEWMTSEIAALLAVADRDKDRELTPREVFRIAPLSKQSFRDGTSLPVGGNRIELVNQGGGYVTPAVFFPAQRVLYVGTNPAFSPGGFGFDEGRPDEVLEWLRHAAKLDFELVITASGATLTHEQFDAVLRYAEDFNTTARDAYTRRRSVDRAAASPSLQKYSGNPLDARRRTNVNRWFETARVSRVEIQGAGFGRMLRRDPRYCDGYDPCTVPDYVVGGSSGLRMTWSRLGAIVEASFGDQYIVERQGDFDDEVLAQRSSRGALLFRVGSTRPSSTSIEFLVGPAFVTHASSGVTRVKQAVAPLGGRHPLSETKTVPAITTGFNLIAPFSRSVSLYVPVRATWLAEKSSALSRRPGRLDAQVGIGFSIRIAQRVR